MDTSILLTGMVSLMAGIIVGGVGLYIYRQYLDNQKKSAAEKDAERIVNRAKSQASKIERDSKKRAKEFEARARKNVEGDIRKQKQKIQSTEAQLNDKGNRLERDYKRKEETLASKMDSARERDERLTIQEGRIKELEAEVNDTIGELRDKLQSVAKMSEDQAKRELKDALEEVARKEASSKLSKIEEEAKAEADKEAKRILSVAISRYASEVSTERTVSIVALTSDEMKGKIIGREGRNIRALEAACGVDLIIDETPEAVVISSFDAVRREVARRTLEKLMEDGRVNPARIEEVVSKVKSELSGTIKEDGEKACFDLGVTGVQPNILNLLGSLKYRQSGTQNLYEHSVEVGYISGLIASELGTDAKEAKRAGLLHDIGKAIDHSAEGSHAVVGADFAKRHGEREAVVHAIRAHDGDEEPRTIVANIVQAANNLSKARPGARRSMMENYVRRLQDLESVGNSFDGVERTFAIQSGKEIRVLVDGGKVTDDQSKLLSRDIARKIEREMNYPGQVKVTVVRETRIVEHAR